MTDTTPIESALVKVYNQGKRYNYLQPSGTPDQVSSSGAGFVTDGNIILTNAHVVEAQSFVNVQLVDDPKKYKARLLHVAHDCDLAALVVDDPEFYKKTSPLSFGEMPNLKDQVTVFGFPMGGAGLSITEGIVSRFELINYAHSSISLLGVQISAAINPGNSGGPVLCDGKVVGVAHQSALFAQNLGYMIPVPVIQHFLNDVKKGVYKGIPGITMNVKTLENVLQRQYYGMSEKLTGVRVADIPKISAAHNKLFKNDILLSIKVRDREYKIDNDGTIGIWSGKRVDFSYAIQEGYIGDTISFGVLRDGKVVEVDVELKTTILGGLLAAEIEFDVSPSYMYISGIECMPLTKNYIDAALSEARGSIPRELLTLADISYNKKFKSTPDEQVIIIKQVLANDETSGYEHVRNVILKKVNGLEVHSMRDLQRVIDDNESEMHVFVTDSGEELIVKNHKNSVEHDMLLSIYGIQSDRSENLKPKEKEPAKGLSHYNSLKEKQPSLAELAETQPESKQQASLRDQVSLIAPSV